MRQGALLNRIVMLVLAAAVVVYLAVYAWNSVSAPFTTVLCYAYALDDAAEATGFLVREETVLPSPGGTAEILPAEGERVARGEAVAVLYQSDAALDRSQSLARLRLELEQLRRSAVREDPTGDSARLSEEVVDAITALRASVAAGDLTGLEDQTMNLRSLIYQREYIFEGDGSAEALDAAVAAKEAEIAALESQSSADTARVRAETPGIFSGFVDGYEALLTPAMLETLTPSALDTLAARRVSADEGALGKLITDSTWYFACALDGETAGRLVEGHTVTVRFSRDWSGEVEMTVESVGEPEGGRAAVVLSADRFLSDTTLLRRQTVELVFSTTGGVRIPKGALRVEQQTVTDEETGEESLVPVTGVYALVGAQAEFKPVTVLAEEEDHCLVRPEPPADGARKILRPGDEIILTAEELFDGKVVR